MTDSDLDRAVAAAAKLLDDGDLAGGIRELRWVAERGPVAALAPLVARAAGLAGFRDLKAAAKAVRKRPTDPKALYDLGYACIERGVAFLAVPALRTALQVAPGDRRILMELVTAYEEESRHRDAVEVLEQNVAVLQPWPDRYLLVFNNLLAGDIEAAARVFADLPRPAEDTWSSAYERVRSMLERTTALAGVTPLDARDLRGWHFALNGGLLGTLSPYGFDAGMTGRYAYLQDSYQTCRLGLDRLRAVLAATGRTPSSVSVLPDRSSTVLALAAARLLGLPALPWAADRTDTLVIAYTLADVDRDIIGQLRARPAGQILAEHATCWTDPPAVAADFSTFLHQLVVAPWDSQLAAGPDRGTSVQAPADQRPVDVLADLVVQASPAADEGDGGTPPDPQDSLARFASSVARWWAVPDRPRERLWSPGPVTSNRFS